MECEVRVRGSERFILCDKTMTEGRKRQRDGVGRIRGFETSSVSQSMSGARTLLWGAKGLFHSWDNGLLVI